MANHKFGLAEAIVLFAVSSLARVFTSAPSDLISFTGQAAWMAPIVGLFICLIQVYFLWMILKPYKDKNLIEITENVMGRYLGTAFNLIFVLTFLGVNMLYLRIFSEGLILSTLPQTPIIIVGGVFIFCAVWAAYLGIESLARSVKIIYPLIFGGILILMLSLIPSFELTNLFPILGKGGKEILIGGALSGSVVVEGLVAAIIINSFSSRKIFPIAISRAMILGFLVLVLLEFVLLLVMHWASALELVLPFYSLSRLIYLGRIFQRVESIFLFIWLFIILIKVALLLYVTIVSLATTLKLKDYKPLILPIALITFMLSFIPADFSSTIYYSSEYLRKYFWIVGLGLPLIVLLTHFLKGRRKTG